MREGTLRNGSLWGSHLPPPWGHHWGYPRGKIVVDVFGNKHSLNVVGPGES